VYCGQTVGWIKMKHGMQIGLGPGHIVLDGDPAHPHKKGTAPTQFLAHTRTVQLYSLGGANVPSSNNCFLRPIRVHISDGKSIGSAVFAGLTSVADRQTDRPTDRQTMLLGR